MFYQRIILVVVFSVSVCPALTSLPRPKNVIIGSRQYGDLLTHREIIRKDSKWLQVIEVHKTFTTDHGEKITQVRLIDQNQDGQGAIATVTVGGPGFTFVTVHFQSTRGKSIEFIAEIYGIVK
ncbi:probable salivary secreted peptide [Phymastichus coffea]|uniref:probable salivary secreted peptide n=1 Tax=Phymastichus coffea TaxID=108790 RepID=UPI00273A7750|nr:probable salivary secreted peptide [Phymastichus coffea]